MGREQSQDAIAITNPGGRGGVLLVCEHASAAIPGEFGGLGLSDEARLSHVAWDPGALAVAEGLSRRLDAPLASGVVSRLVYDLNRPPESPGAMPEQSEIHSIPGNAGLSEAARAARVARYYAPFHEGLSRMLDGMAALVTVHSFTPSYHGARREVEIGVLHDSDARLADAMLARPPAGYLVRRNDPYGPADGVTHTLIRHALPRGLPNVMLEVRNDLIASAAAQEAMAGTLADWLTAALGELRAAA